MVWSVIVLLLIALAGALVLGVVLAFAGNAVYQLTRTLRHRGRA